MFLSCPLVLVITLAVDVQSGPAVSVAHELLHHFYPFTLLDQERCKRMAEGMPADRLFDPRPDCSRTKLSLQRGVERERRLSCPLNRGKDPIFVAWVETFSPPLLKGDDQGLGNRHRRT